jgi:hypothetical protein
MKKKLALMLATITTVASLFTGCGEKDVTGNYVATLRFADLTDFEDSDVESMEEMGIDPNNLSFDVKLNMTDDKKFDMSFDTTEFKKEFQNGYTTYLNDHIDEIIDMALAEYGMTVDDVTDEVAIANNYESADAFLEDMKSQTIEQTQQAMDEYLDGIIEEMESETVSGTYKVSKNTVVFVVEDGDESSLDKGTINDDGSIKVVSEADGKEVTFDFQLQK